jgi:flagellar export protein FliJ
MPTPYDAAIRLRKTELDDLRRAMGELTARQADLEERLAELERKLEEESGVVSHAAAGGDALGVSTYAAFALRNRIDRVNVQADMAALEAEIEAVRETLLEAFEGFKTLDVAREAFLAEARAAADKREQTDLDEAALQRHIALVANG